tara:strand:+ start:862 stop:1002 length:141 start_codon:yes stop_codon:yes gene_type:complete
MKKVITIDGPSGVGKTTIGQEIALNLNYSSFLVENFIGIYLNILMM